jgi:ectoine hydroxylase-related dioxygenase (phytanoyl-CoA dioxygenase family)
MIDVMERTKRGPVTVVDTDWSSLSRQQSLAHLNVQGYTVLPRLLDAATMARVTAELADLKMNVAPYSPEQKFAASPPQWHSRAFAEIIGLPRMIDFLKGALGDEIVFMLGHYVRSGPGVPGLSLHSDYQPYGSPQKGWNESSPATVRVLIYMDDLTLDRAPFTIVPGSHLSLHTVANPYMRYDDHPDMVTLTLKAGDAIVFNVRAFHGTHPHTGAVGRSMLEYAFRPAWARCAGVVEEWDPADVAAAPDIAKPFLTPRNGGDAESKLGQLVQASDPAYAGLAPAL